MWEFCGNDTERGGGPLGPVGPVTRPRLRVGTAKALLGVVVLLSTLSSQKLLSDRTADFETSRRGDSIRLAGETREWSVRFIHRITNLTPDTLRAVNVGIAVPVSDPSARARLTELLRSRAGKTQFALMRALWLFASIEALRLDPR